MQVSELSTLIGTAIGGRGIAKYLFYKEEFPASLFDGGRIYPGSLNLVLDRPIFLDPAQGIPFAGGARYLWKASIASVERPIFIYRWKGCPLHIIEIVSTHRLRDILGVYDGSKVEILFRSRNICSVNYFTKIIWWLIWGRRESWYYKHECYKRIIDLSRLGIFCAQ